MDSDPSAEDNGVAFDRCEASHDHGRGHWRPLNGGSPPPVRFRQPRAIAVQMNRRRPHPTRYRQVILNIALADPESANRTRLDSAGPKPDWRPFQ